MSTWPCSPDTCWITCAAWFCRKRQQTDSPMMKIWQLSIDYCQGQNVDVVEVLHLPHQSFIHNIGSLDAPISSCALLDAGRHDRHDREDSHNSHQCCPSHMFNLQCHTVLVHHSAGSQFPKWLANQGIDDESWVHCYTEWMTGNAIQKVDKKNLLLPTRMSRED